MHEFNNYIALWFEILEISIGNYQQMMIICLHENAGKKKKQQNLPYSLIIFEILGLIYWAIAFEI